MFKLTDLPIDEVRKKYNELVEEYAYGDILDVGKSRHWEYCFPTIDLNPKLKPTYVGDIQCTDFEDSTFDVVFCNGMYEYVHDKQAMINECIRISKAYVIFGFVGRSYPKLRENWKHFEGKEAFPVALKKVIEIGDGLYYFIICEKPYD
jgi:SAM-dependent methyltransferase